MKIENTKIYIDPDFDDCQELGADRWDTLRLYVLDKPEWLCLASGYGHTHQCVARAVRVALGDKRLSGDCHIMFHERGQYFLNIDDLTSRRDADRVPLAEALRYFPPSIRAQLKELAKCHSEHRY